MGQVLNKRDFDAARAVREARLKELGYVSVCMAPGDANAGHSHTLVEEILVVQKGKGAIQIENETYPLKPGSVAVVPAGQFHATCNTGNENLEGFVIFNRNVDRKAVVLKSRKAHFGKAAPAAASKAAGRKKEASANAKLKAEVKALKKANKKLKKKLKKALD